MKKIENYLYLKKYKNIAGIDEAGRGCWAGPLVVAICVLNENYVNPKIKDSKQLSENVREKLFDEIINDSLLVDWIIFDPEFVDKNNPKKTSIIGMEWLVNKHINKIDYCLIDAEAINVSLPTMSIIKGDSLSQTIAAASIVAKVIRDRIMKELAKEYPNFSFESNKGYGTKSHQQALEKFGPIKNVHRFSYKPIKKLLD